MAIHYDTSPAIIHTIDEEKCSDRSVNRSEIIHTVGTTPFRYSVLLEDFWNWDDEDDEEDCDEEEDMD